jgi:hypothetical protein
MPERQNSGGNRFRASEEGDKTTKKSSHPAFFLLCCVRAARKIGFFAGSGSARKWPGLLRRGPDRCRQGADPGESGRFQPKQQLRCTNQLYGAHWRD